MYKKHHGQVAGETVRLTSSIYFLISIMASRTRLVDAIAERIQILGGVSIAMAADVAETTIIPRPPRGGREEVPVQISRLLEAHEFILKSRVRWRGRLPKSAMTERMICW